MTRNRRFWQVILVVGDLACVAGSMYLALWTRHIQFRSKSLLGDMIVDPFWDFTGSAAITMAVLVPVFYVTEMYEFKVNSNRLRHAVRLIIAMAAATLLVTTVFYWLPQTRLFRLAQVYNTAFTTAALFVWRMLVFDLIYTRLPRRRLLIVGSGKAGSLLAKTVRDQPDLLFDPVGFVDDDPALHGTEIHGIPVLGDTGEMRAIAERESIGVIVLAITANLGERTLRNLFECKVAGHQVTDMARLYKECTRRIPLLHVNDQWFISGPDFLAIGRPWRQRLIRAFDLSLSLVGLLLAAPLMALTAVAIKLDTRGTVLFRQIRVGQGEKPYTILKFRTMTMDAERGTGAVWAQADDARVTRLGKFLRRTRIDELPQLWNVLMGEMAFVGPRPERPEFVEQLERKIPYYSLRFAVKPGLTGWAQVNYKYGASENDALEKLQYELYYMQEESLLLLMVVLARTVQTVLFRSGS